MKYLKYLQGLHHCVELVEIIKMEFWFTQFGVRKTKLWPLQKAARLIWLSLGEAARPTCLAAQPPLWSPGLWVGRPATTWTARPPFGLPGRQMAAKEGVEVNPTSRTDGRPLRHLGYK